jgi:DNA-binding phage protein
MQISDYITSVGDDASVAAKAGLDRTTISRIRRGVSDPPLSTVARIVRGTGGRIIIESPVAVAQTGASV